MGIATFGTGCFWCTEAVFLQLKGVKSVVSGFSGGYIETPSYEQVMTGTTGHAEVCQIEFAVATLKALFPGYSYSLPPILSEHDL